ncbi:MAG: hypothetical protein GF364_21300 [Candidatus Lokiarchaeota archaeon]|nr:hypothetical protein [Candidatus Lokiarchaeota archaeon]
MSYLTISYNRKKKKKELNVMSLQQIVGKHISIKLDKPIKNAFIDRAKKNVENYNIIEEKIFNVMSPNRTDITFSGSGKSPWTLVVGSKGVRKKLFLLFIGNKIWGLELDSGISLKREANKLGQDRLIKFLKKQVFSMLDTPEKWESIDVYLRT